MTAKKATKQTAKVTHREDEEADQLPTRGVMDPETAGAVLAADHAEEQGDGWPDEITLTLAIGEDEVPYTYAVSPVDEVLSFIQMAFMLDTKNDDKMRSFIQGVLAPGEYQRFADEMKAYMLECKRLGHPVQATEFFEQVSEQIFDRFNQVVTPKGGQRSTGRRGTGQRSRLPR